MWHFFFFKQKTAYEMRISDWSSDVCSSDLSWRVSSVDGEADDADQLVALRDDAHLPVTARIGGEAALVRPCPIAGLATAADLDRDAVDQLAFVPPLMDDLLGETARCVDRRPCIESGCRQLVGAQGLDGGAGGALFGIDDRHRMRAMHPQDRRRNREAQHDQCASEQQAGDRKSTRLNSSH